MQTDSLKYVLIWQTDEKQIIFFSAYSLDLSLTHSFLEPCSSLQQEGLNEYGEKKSLFIDWNSVVGATLQKGDGVKKKKWEMQCEWSQLRWRLHIMQMTVIRERNWRWLVSVTFYQLWRSSILRYTGCVQHFII